MSNIKKSTTLAELAGTNRGLSKLTVADLKSLLKGEAPAKAVVAKPTSEFYEKVIVGGREHRENRQKANTAAAAWMREHGLVPSGSAWTAVKNGERNVKALKAMNESDGYTGKPKSTTKGSTTTTKPKAKGSKVKASETHEAVTERDVEAEVKTLMTGGFSEDEARAILG